MKNKAIQQEVKRWDWKNQRIWEDEKELNVPSLISRIERWYYITEEFDLDLNSIDLSNLWITVNNLFDFIAHMQITKNSKLKYPVIMNKSWFVLDGRHRIAKAILQWRNSIRVIKIVDCNVI